MLGFYYKKFGDTFFYPEKYYSISQELVLTPELLNGFAIYTPQKVPYIIEPDKLDWVFRFMPQTDFVHLTIAAEVRGAFWPITTANYVDALPPFILKGESMYFFRYPTLSLIIRKLHKPKPLLLDIYKYLVFKTEKLPVLSEKGLKVVMGSPLDRLQEQKKPCAVRWRLRLFRQKLYAKPYFIYGERTIAARHKAEYLLLNTKGHYCRRDLACERDSIAKFTDAGFIERGNLYELRADRMYLWLRDIAPTWPSQQIVSKKDLSLLQFSDHALVPQFQLIQSTDPFFVRVHVKLYFDGKPQSLTTYWAELEQGRRFYQAKSGDIVELQAHEHVYYLLQQADVRVPDHFESNVHLGAAIELYENLKGLCVSDHNVDSLLTSKSGEDSALARMPAEVMATLHPYQKAGVYWMLKLNENHLNGVLADDMGLGKTLQTLTLLAGLHHEKRAATLVVVPTTLLFNWEAEIQKYTPILKVLRYEGRSRENLAKKMDEADIVLISYTVLRRDIRKLANKRFYYVVLDEAQTIKNPQSKTTQAVMELKSEHRLALTGTPIENRITEIWSIFHFLLPAYFKDINAFKAEFIGAPSAVPDPQKIAELQTRIRPFILRRMKENIALELPPKTESYVYCDLGEHQAKLYQDVLDKHKSVIREKIETEGFRKAQVHIFSLLTQLRQICCHPNLVDSTTPEAESHKFELLKDRIEQLLPGRHKIVIFSQFVRMLTIMQTWLDDMEVPYEILTGQTKDRQGVVNRFNEDASVRIILVSLKAGGTGINLTAADYVFHYDPWWNPAVENQASDRVHRIGQNKPVFVYKMLTKNTVEDKIYQIQFQKKAVYQQLLNESAGFSPILKAEDVDYLLQDYTD